MVLQRANLDAFCFDRHKFKASLGTHIPLLALLLLPFCTYISPAYATLPIAAKAFQYAAPDLFDHSVGLNSSSTSSIQLKTDSLRVDSTVTGLIPALSYSTDVGLAGGLIWSKLSYGEQDPFKQNIAVTALASTKGLAGFNFFLDQPCSFNCVDRLLVNLVGNRFLEDQYYGVFTDQRLDLQKNPKRYTPQS